MCTHRLSVTGRNHNLSRWRQVITHLKQTECDMSLRDCWHSLQLQHLKVLSNEMYCFLLRFNSPFLSYLRLQKPSLTQLSLSVSLYPTPAPKVWKRSHADGSVKLLKLWIWHPYWMLISISVYVPTSKRSSTLHHLAPAGLCKKCTALNLPNCCCFNCEEETKAGNYTCRMENNREGWQWRRREQRDRREDRQERVTRGKQDNDLFRLSPPVKRETVKGWLWSATYFSMRSNVTPGTNLALFCIQNLGGKTQGKVSDQGCNENKRGSQTRQCNKSVWPLQHKFYDQWGKQSADKHSNEKRALQRLQPLSTDKCILAELQSKGRGEGGEIHIVFLKCLSGAGVVYYARLAPRGRASCKSQQEDARRWLWVITHLEERRCVHTSTRQSHKHQLQEC